jgi:hypothetical protein
MERIIIIIKDIVFVIAVFSFSFKLSIELIKDANESLDFSAKKFSIEEGESSRLWKILTLLSLVGVGRTIILLKSIAILFIGIPISTIVFLAYKFYKKTGYSKELVVDSIILVGVVVAAIINLLI